MIIKATSRSTTMLYVYYGLTILLSFFFALSGYWEVTKNDINYPKTLKMGYPPYFILALGIAKICGAIVLVVPGFKRLKEWAYAGFVFDVVFAFISGLSISSTADWVKASIAFCILIFNYSLFHKMNDNVSGKHTIA